MQVPRPQTRLGAGGGGRRGARGTAANNLPVPAAMSAPSAPGHVGRLVGLLVHVPTLHPQTLRPRTLHRPSPPNSPALPNAPHASGPRGPAASHTAHARCPETLCAWDPHVLHMLLLNVSRQSASIRNIPPHTLMSLLHQSRPEGSWPHGKQRHLRLDIAGGPRTPFLLRGPDVGPWIPVTVSL